MTPDHQIVWEYISPYFGQAGQYNLVYRAYRLPYEWVPQLEPPQETPVEPVEVSTFRVPGAAAPGVVEATEVAGVKPYQRADVVCVLSSGDLVKD